MKRFILSAALAGLIPLMANADCMDVVHKHTMAPVSEMKSLGVDSNGITTVVRTKNTQHIWATVELRDDESLSTVFQCNGKGEYRQYLTVPALGWSQWRNGKEWNAVHWMTF